MKRLFQDYEGVVESLQGLRLKSLKYLYDLEKETQSVILFWLQTERAWLRIFIDGFYCGIDEYPYDNSDNDTDDEVAWQEQDDWVAGHSIVLAKVESGDLPEITLTIVLSNHSHLLLICDQEEECRLEKREATA